MQYNKLLLIMFIASFAVTGCGGGDSGGSDEPKQTITDSDNDGVADAQDAFPNDASETTDTDNDGVGDNSDAFVNDASETKDTDNDGVGDNADAFPNDATETLDTDNDGYGDNIDYKPEDSTIWLASQVKYSGICTPDGDTVNFNALLSEDCEYLSAYNLFADETNPTQNVNGSKSLPYDLTMPLFTDYASKYRFVVMPEDKSGSYNDVEVLDLPVGTVLVKTFSMPNDTANTGFENETLIETRLLIHRESGWDAVPYVWNAEGTDAQLAKYGKQLADTKVTHDGTDYNFTYVVPAKSDCKQCHQITATNNNGEPVDGQTRFEPIGPKARLLNVEMTYSDNTKNQLLKWAEVGLLTGLPAELSAIDTVPEFTDTDITTVLSLPTDKLTDYAKGYFDINCAHCHRPEGSASNTGLHVEYWRDFATEQTKHGVCKQPIAYGGEGLGYDIEPGVPAESIVYARMNSNDPKDRMPEIGRSLIHKEGVMLIQEWINRLNAEPYNLGSCTDNSASHYGANKRSQ